MKIIITGGTGLIGCELTQTLARDGHQLTSLVREVKLPSNHPATFLKWNVEHGQIEDTPKLDRHDAVIHLAGESVAEGRWTEERKRRIRDSRVKGTRLLVQTLARLNQPPKIFLSASAIGFYGADRLVSYFKSVAPADLGTRFAGTEILKDGTTKVLMPHSSANHSATWEFFARYSGRNAVARSGIPVY